MIVVLAFAVAGAAACSGDGGEKARPGAGPTAPRPVPAAQLAAVTLPGSPGPLVDVITRQVGAAGTVRAEHTSAGTEGSKKLEERISAQLRTGVRPPSAQMTIIDRDPAGPGTTEAVVSGGVIYTRVDGEEQAPGKPWVRLSRQDASNPELAPFAKMLAGLVDEVERSLAQLSTDTGLALVRNGAFTGAPVAETLEGLRVRRYSGVTPASKLSGTEKAFQALSKAGLKQITWRLWVDDKGLPRKFQADYSTPQKLRGSQTVTYSRWGEPVLIQTPPANKVHKIGT
ncbi:hypothetical protein GCM10010191_35860 [Actinomadura vinacea]|uniref:LppX_LprAFG lipoprotein n=1 Tax=Actinomadura vinacea TaxID=115336 RepID=A0ABP5W7J5_9ACTN